MLGSIFVVCFKSLQISKTVKMRQSRASRYSMTFSNWYFKPLNIHSQNPNRTVFCSEMFTWANKRNGLLSSFKFYKTDIRYKEVSYDFSFFNLGVMLLMWDSEVQFKTPVKTE